MNLSSDVIIQAVVTGLMLGGLYALISVGLSLIYGTLKIINFAHGEMLMIGLYIAYFLVAEWKMDPYVTIPLTFVGVFLIGMIIFKLFISPVVEAPVMNQLILTWGISIALQGCAFSLFTANVLTVPTKYTQMTIRLGEIVIGTPQLIAAIGSIVGLVGLYLFLQKTEPGCAIRAASQNALAAGLMGINVKRIYLLAFGLGSGLVGVAASLMIPFYYASPTVGVTLGLFAFYVIVLGGQGSIGGCLIGGLIIGLTESVGAAILPGSLSRVAVLVVFMAFLIFKPEGIMTRRQA